MKIAKFVDTWMGENTYIGYFDDCKDAFIVDPSLVVKQIKRFVDQEKLNVKYIILTHSHSDHIADVDELKEMYGAEIIAHKDEKELLNDSEKNLSATYHRGRIEFEADRYVSEGDTLDICGETATFIHTPGHTKGGMCIRIGEDMFTGDTIFNGDVGRTDLYSGDYDQLLNSLKKLSKEDDNIRIHPGHGPSSTIGAEKEINHYMKLVL